MGRSILSATRITLIEIRICKVRRLIPLTFSSILIVILKTTFVSIFLVLFSEVRLSTLALSATCNGDFDQHRPELVLVNVTVAIRVVLSKELSKSLFEVAVGCL